jgi:3-hydroxyisobutyrate dehydrogenase-like beta-hydroxyacid dehydrogenase
MLRRPGRTRAPRLDLVAKDLDLILALADEVGVRMDQAGANRAVVESAVEAGLADEDLSAVAVFLREKTSPAE